MTPSLRDLAFALPQYALPQHGLSRLMHRLTRCEDRRFKNGLIRVFARLYGVDLHEASNSRIEDYRSFNDFFTRALKPEARPIARDPRAVVSAADGTISQIGRLEGQHLIQAKGKRFGVPELLGGDPELARAFDNGAFATIYLSPRDYHRLHMPVDGALRQMIHIPGRLFSVNEATTAVVDRLFARNERVVALFDTPCGLMALVLVGAIFVASIETAWHGVVTPAKERGIRRWSYDPSERQFGRGEEMGRFNMGSTVILLFGEQAVTWQDDLAAGQAVRMGQVIGRRV